MHGMFTEDFLGWVTGRLTYLLAAAVIVGLFLLLCFFLLHVHSLPCPQGLVLLDVFVVTQDRIQTFVLYASSFIINNDDFLS